MTAATHFSGWFGEDALAGVPPALTALVQTTTSTPLPTLQPGSANATAATGLHSLITHLNRCEWKTPDNVNFKINR